MDLAYFFIPLPEPLGLPDRLTLSILTPPTDDELLEYGAGDQHTASDEAARWLSCRIRQSDRDHPGLGELRALFDVANRAFPNLPEPSAEEASPPLLAHCTVAEMAVPILNSNDEMAISDAFDDALQALRDIQRTYYLLGNRYPVRLVTREALPHMIPFAIRRNAEDPESWPESINIFLLNWNLHEGVRPPEIGDELDHFEIAHEMLSSRAVFSGHLEFSREADVALIRDGNYRAAAIASATAAELLLDDLLGHLLWEDCVRPEDAAEIFDRGGLAARVRAEYHSRIGGDWTSPSSAVQGWRHNTAGLRHRIVHGGYEPGLDEARLSRESLSSLTQFLCDRLGARQVRRRYPRTSHRLLGESGLRSRGQWDQGMQDLVDDPTEPHWATTYIRWREAVGRLRAEGRELWDRPSTVGATVVVVFVPEGGRYFVAHDRRAEMAGRLPPREELVPEWQRESIAQLEHALRSTDMMEAVSSALVGVEPWAQPDVWVPQYRLLPLLGVMVDGGDLDELQ